MWICDVKARTIEIQQSISVAVSCQRNWLYKSRTDAFYLNINFLFELLSSSSLPFLSSSAHQISIMSLTFHCVVMIQSKEIVKNENDDIFRCRILIRKSRHTTINYELYYHQSENMLLNVKNIYMLQRIALVKSFSSSLIQVRQLFIVNQLERIFKTDSINSLATFFFGISNSNLWETRIASVRSSDPRRCYHDWNDRRFEIIWSDQRRKLHERFFEIRSWIRCRSEKKSTRDECISWKYILMFMLLTILVICVWQKRQKISNIYWHIWKEDCSRSTSWNVIYFYRDWTSRMYVNLCFLKTSFWSVSKLWKSRQDELYRLFFTKV